ncbi:MAG: WD40 repeat domain-containing protein, partial [Bacillota bacterium]
LWERRFKDGVYRYARAFSLAGGRMIGAVALAYYDKGFFYLFDRDGKGLWPPKLISGSVTPAASLDGSLLAILNESNHYLELLTASGEEVAHIQVSDRVTLRFTDDGEYLYLLDGDQIIVVDRRGERHKFGGRIVAPGELQVAPDGRYLAVTTNDGTDYLNLFRPDGTLKWRYTIDSGGTDKLSFSSDGRYLVLYDFGLRGGIAVFRVEDGAVMWRSYFTPPDGRRAFIRSASIRSDSLEVAVNYTESYRVGRQTVEEHTLIVFDRRGRPESRVRLPDNVDLRATGDGSVMVVTTNNEIKADGTVSQQLFWYDILALFHAEGGS